MGRRMSPQTMKILAMLEDGNWHEREELVQAATQVIPPGIAYRQAETLRRGNFAARGKPGLVELPARTKMTDASDIVATGARSLVTASLHSLTVNGRIEREERDGKKVFRLTQAINRVIKVVNMDGKIDLVVDPNANTTTVDLVHLMNPTTPIEEVELVMKELQTYPDRWKGVKEVRDMVRTIINNKNVSRALIRYDKERAG